MGAFHFQLHLPLYMTYQILSFKEINRTGSYLLMGKPVFVPKECVAILDEKNKTVKLVERWTFELDYKMLNQWLCVEHNLFK